MPGWLDFYSPLSIWYGLDTYVEIMVEKVDLKILFGPVCERYSVPLTNSKGSTDINSRRRMLQRFRMHHQAGRVSFSVIVVTTTPLAC